MNIPELESGKTVRTPLATANEAFRQGNFAGAIALYAEVIVQQPGLSKSISANLSLARQKYRTSRQANAKTSVAVCGWELAHNAAGRAYTLATIYETFAHVEIVGCLFPRSGREIWEPIRDTKIAKHTFIVEDESKFIEQAIQLVAAHPYDIVHLSKPRAPNIFFGILYKLLWGAKVLMDIDDEELAFVGAETPVSIDDYIQQHGKLPELKDLAGKDWTRLAVGLAKEFDGLTVCNAALQQRYGGEIVRHARESKVFSSSQDSKNQSRAKYGIPEEAKVVLFLGTPQKHKGLIETAEAIALLKCPEIIYFIVGSFHDKSLKQKLQSVKDCNFKFLPDQSIDKTPEILAASDCVVLILNENSQIAAFQTPAKLSDALAARLPILAQGITITSELNQDFVIPSDSTEDLSKRISKILFDDGYRQNVQARFKHIFEEKFSVSVNSKVLNNIIENSLSNPSRHIVNKSLAELTEKSIFYKQQVNIERHKSAPKNISRQNHIPNSKNSPGRSLTTLITTEQKELTKIPEEKYLVLGNNLSNDRRKRICHEKIPYFTIVVYADKQGPSLRLTLESLASVSESFDVSVTLICDWENKFHFDIPYIEGKNTSTLVNKEKKGFYKSIADFIKSSLTKNILIIRAGVIITEHGVNQLVKTILTSKSLDVGSLLSNTTPFGSVPMKAGFNIHTTCTNAQHLFGNSKVSNRLIPSLDCFMITYEAIKAVPFPAWSFEQDRSVKSLIRWFQALYDAGISSGVVLGSYYYSLNNKLLDDEELGRSLDPSKPAASLEKLQEDVSNEKLLKDAWDACIPTIMPGGTICFFLQSLKLGGGGLVIVNLANHLIVLGYDVRVYAKHLSENYKTGFNLLFEIKHYSKLEHIASEIPEEAICVATLWTTARDVEKLISSNTSLRGFYYIQDYEPYFYSPTSDDLTQVDHHKSSLESYSLKLKWIYTSDWIKSQLEKNGHATGIDSHKVNVGIDHSIFFPSSGRDITNDKKKKHLTIGAMARPSTPRRGFQLLINSIKLIKQKYPDLEIVFFGEESYDNFKIPFEFISKGILRPDQLPDLYQSFDIFIDTSDFQGFGLCALEAMSSGCNCVITDSGGISEYALNNKNALIVSHTPEAIASAVSILINDASVRRTLSENSIQTVRNFDIYQNAKTWVSIIGVNNSVINYTDQGCAVIVPVFNNMQVVRRCINSVLKTLGTKDILIVVDDHSDSYTAKELQQIEKQNKNIRLVRNFENLGFVGASNRGMKLAQEDNRDVVLLNSDTIVPEGWIERLRNAAYFEKIPAIASPLATESSHLKLTMNPGDSFSIADRLLQSVITPSYPEIVTPEGWCFYLPKAIYKQVGFLDPIFGRGYCEESDLCMRALCSGFKLRCCDNLLVFHQGKVSFGEERSQLYNKNRKFFDRRWSKIYERIYTSFIREDHLNRLRHVYLKQSVEQLLTGNRNFDSITDVLKERVLEVAVEKLRKSNRETILGQTRVKSLAFLLPEYLPYGGVISVVSLANELILMGVDAKIVVLKSRGNKSMNLQSLTQPIFLENYNDLLKNFPIVDLIVMTGWITVYYAALVGMVRPEIKFAYYVQDFEPDFPDVKSNSEFYEAAMNTYKLNLPSFCKSEWIRQRIKKEAGVGIELVPPAVELDNFYRRDTKPDEEAIDLLAMYRPDTAQRDPETLLGVVKRVRASYPSVKIAFFGEVERSRALVTEGIIDVSLGIVRNEELPSLYSRSKIFLETSIFHGFGRTIAEAMACGCACVITRSGGPMDFARENENCLIAEPRDVDGLASKALMLLRDQKVRGKLQDNARKAVLGFGATQSAKQIHQFLKLNSDTQG